MKDGDLLVTSGRGGQVPVGLPVGIVETGDADAPPTITLLDEGRDLLYVRIVRMEAIETPPDQTRIISGAAGSGK